MAILITLIGFGIMIFLHELGHFITAKKFGVIVHEFAIGMGPKLISFRKGETKYSLRLLPIGGYVQLEGENEKEESDNPRSFANITPLKRIVILAAGAFMNLLLGFLIFTIINVNVGVTPTVIDKIPDEYKHYVSQLESGDEIISLDDTRVHMRDEVSLFMSNCDEGDTIDITLKRNGKVIKIDDYIPIKTEYGYMLGVQFKNIKPSIITASRFALYDTVYVTKAVIYAVRDLITGRVGLNSLSGPVEIVAAVDSVASNNNPYTLMSILMLFAMISVNLGIFNLLPFPALDGGSIIFALYELITKKKVKGEIISYASLIGFALLMLLAIYVTAGDIAALTK